MFNLVEITAYEPKYIKLHRFTNATIYLQSKTSNQTSSIFYIKNMTNNKEKMFINKKAPAQLSTEMNWTQKLQPMKSIATLRHHLNKQVLCEPRAAIPNFLTTAATSGPLNEWFYRHEKVEKILTHHVKK